MKATRASVRAMKAAETMQDRIACLEEQNERILAILEVMLTKPQREKLEALLNPVVDDEPEETEGDDEPEGS